MTDLVILAYKAKPGQEQALHDAVREYTPLLQRLGFATDRAPVLMQSADGPIVHVFEWKDGAMASAHENAEVIAIWGRIETASTYVPLEALSEAKNAFARFEAVS